MSSCTKHKLPHEFYKFMPHSFINSLTDISLNWQQNGGIPSVVSWGMKMLLKKDADKWVVQSKFQPITPLNTWFKVIAMVLVKWPVLVINSLVREVQMCMIPNRYVHDNLQLMWYLIGRAEPKADLSEVLINLDRSKEFKMIKHCYLEVTLKSATYQVHLQGIGQVWATEAIMKPVIF